MEYNYVQVSASTGWSVEHSVTPTYLVDGIALTDEIGLRCLNCFWIVAITLFLNGCPQESKRISGNLLRKRSIVAWAVCNGAPSCLNSCHKFQ